MWCSTFSITTLPGVLVGLPELIVIVDTLAGLLLSRPASYSRSCCCWCCFVVPATMPDVLDVCAYGAEEDAVVFVGWLCARPVLTW